MEPKEHALFRDIVFATCRILYGDTDATMSPYQTVVSHALVDLGVYSQICDAMHTDGEPRRNSEIPYD